MRLRGAEPEVARHRHLGAGAQARPVGRHDDRLLDALHLVVEEVVRAVPAAPRVRRRLRSGEPVAVPELEVEPGAEVAAGAGDHHHAQVVAAPERVYRLPQRLGDLRTDRVELLGSVQGDGDHAVGLVDERVRCFVHDRSLHSTRSVQPWALKKKPPAVTSARSAPSTWRSPARPGAGAPPRGCGPIPGCRPRTARRRGGSPGCGRRSGRGSTSSSQCSARNAPASPGPQNPAFSNQFSVMMVKPSYGKYTSHVVDPEVALGPERVDHHLLAVVAQARGLVLLVLADLAERRRVDEHGPVREVARPLGGGDDERVGAVDRDVHVEQAQRPADHPRVRGSRPWSAGRASPRPGCASRWSGR